MTSQVRTSVRPSPPTPPGASAAAARAGLGGGGWVGLAGRLVQPRRVTLVVGIVLALGVGAWALAFRLPAYPSDQLYYFDFGWSFPHPHPLDNDPEFFQRYPHLFLRHGLILPIRLAQLLFGYSQAAYLAVPLVAAMGLAVGVYLIGTLLFSRLAGAAAAVLVVGNTMVFPDLTQPLPDLPATALVVWAVALAIAVRQRRRLVTASPRREAVALVLIGALLGWSYLVREYIVFVWPVVPLVLLRRLPIRRMLWIAAPLVAVGAGEAILDGIVFDDPLARWHAASTHGSVPPAVPITDYLGHSPRWYFTRVVALMGAMPEGVWLKAALGLSVLGAVFSRKLAFLLAWAAFFYLPLVILGGVYNPEHPMLRILKERYWIPLVPAVILGAVGAVFLLIRAVVRRVPGVRVRAGLVAGLVACVAVVTPVVVAHHGRTTDLDRLTSTYAWNGGTQLEAFRTWLAHNGSDVRAIWADQRSVRLVKVYDKGTFGRSFWHGAVHTWYVPGHPYQPVPTPAPSRGDYVFFYSGWSQVCGYCRGNAEALLDSRPLSVPASWRLAFATPDRLVAVYQIR